MLSWTRKIFQFKELLINLTVKELKLKYRDSVLGFFWSFFNPVIMMVIYTFAFKLIMKVQIQNYTVFILCGLLPWTFYQATIQGSTTSIISAGGLLKKVYFAREVLPLSLALSNFVNFLITLAVLLFASFFVFDIHATIALLVLPLILLILFIFTFGLSLALSSLNVFYRDISHFVEVFFALFFYLTPIIYSLEMMPAKYRPFLYLNPMTPIVLSIREIVLQGQFPSLQLFSLSLFWACIMLVVGARIFTRLEYKFAEEV